MLVSRYVILKHSANDIIVNPDGQTLSGRIPHHEHFGLYHWVRMDSNFVFMIARMHVEHLPLVSTHDAVAVLPSIHSNAKLGNHLRSISRGGHTAALVSVGANEGMACYDLCDYMADNYHSIFLPEY